MRVELTRISKEDESSLRIWRNDPAVSQWMYTNHEISVDEHAAWFSSMLSDATKVYWKIVVDGHAVGSIFLTGISAQQQQCSWGMYLADQQMRGKGVAQGACALSFQFAFTELGMQKVLCEAVAENEIAIGLYESVGFKRTGMQRDAVKRGNEMLSVVTLEITRDAWNAHEPELLQRLEEKGVSING